MTAMADPETGTGNLGFSLVEVLVVLLVAGAISTGIGALYHMVAEAMDRRQELVAISDTLLRLHGLAEALDHEPDLDQLEVDATGTVALSALSDPQGERVWMELRDEALTTRGLPGMRDSSLSLAGFDTHALTFLSGRGQLEWRSEPLDPVVAARLDLGRGGRRWEVMLWMAPKSVQ